MDGWDLLHALSYYHIDITHGIAFVTPVDSIECYQGKFVSKVISLHHVNIDNTGGKGIQPQLIKRYALIVYIWIFQQSSLKPRHLSSSKVYFIISSAH